MPSPLMLPGPWPCPSPATLLRVTTRGGVACLSCGFADSDAASSTAVSANPSNLPTPRSELTARRSGRLASAEKHLTLERILSKPKKNATPCRKTPVVDDCGEVVIVSESFRRYQARPQQIGAILAKKCRFSLGRKKIYAKGCP